MKTNWAAMLFDVSVVAMFSYAIFEQHRNPWCWAFFCILLCSGSGSYRMGK